MSSDLRTSEGPDRFRSSIRCRQFHDRPDLDLNGVYNCCCCNPCRHIRPGGLYDLKKEMAYAHCCRCVPRAIFLRFVPDDPDHECCSRAIEAMFYEETIDEDNEPVSTYSGSLFNVAVSVRLGRMDTSEYSGVSGSSGSGSGPAPCAWKITATRESDVNFEVVIPIDHILTTCLNAPEIDLASIEGPAACMGKLRLANITKARVPYIERQDVHDFPNVYAGERAFHCLCPDDCDDENCSDAVRLYDLDSLDCVSVQAERFQRSGYENGYPTFTYDDYKIFWWIDGSTGDGRWMLVDTLYPDSYQPYGYNPIAWGKTRPECLFGPWATSLGENGYSGPQEEAIINRASVFLGHEPGQYSAYLTTPGSLCVSRCVDEECNPPEERFISCGDLRQVCTILCATGTRRVGGQDERVEFGWFRRPVGYTENSGPGGSGGSGSSECDEPETQWEQGWEYTDPETDHTERIFLRENALGQCTLVPQLEGEGGVENFSPVVIGLEPHVVFRARVPGGGSCGMTELFSNTEKGLAFAVRCGFCSCWEFYCGSCRCVPQKMCVSVFEGEEFTPNIILDWDIDSKCWIRDDPGYGPDIRICLQKDSKGRCILVPVMNPPISWPDDYQFPVYNTGNELDVSKRFSPEADIISAQWETYEDPARPLLIVANSLNDECDIWPCTEATPCRDYCGSHPPTTYLTMRGWNDPYEDEPYVVGDCAVTVTMRFIQRIFFTGTLPLEVQCYYQGLYDLGNCNGTRTWLKVKSTRYGIEWEHIANGVALGATCNQGQPVLWDTQSCNPYYADTGVIPTGLTDNCFCCPGSEPQQRMQIIGTE